MSLPKYPHYKPSGVEWLGDVPAHWEIFRMASLFRDVNEPGNDDLPVLSVSIHDGVSDKELDENEMDRKVTRSDDRSKYKSVMPGDLTYNMMRAWQGGFGTVGTHGMVSPAYVVARPVRPFMTFFVEMILRTQNAVAEMKRHSRGVTDFRLRLYWEEFKCIEIALPPDDEQSEIVDFIRYETAKIDALIAEQEKLIHLLAEKRQATISHAVTRGLDPAAPMKDSGVAWLGEVPAHWHPKRLKNVSPFITVGIVVNPSDYVAEEGLPFIYGGDIAEGRISISGSRRISPDDSAKQAKTKLEAGDLLTVRVGAPGVTAVVPESCAGGNCASVMLTRRGDFDSMWLCYAMNSRMVRFQVEVVQYGAAQEQFNISHAINFWVMVPPLAEQNDIAQFLDVETTRLDTLRAEAERAIALLKERRAALIAAAVTGQIDVRGARPA